MRVQHNIPAMNAYRNYTNNTKAINKNLEKLSSGYRINRAGDDAAGLAISEKMRAQITGLATAQKNAKDGISLVQTAEGALTEVHSMLNRMFELAEQSANGTYDNEVDRANLQKEFDALRSEIDRIADSSNFNGTKLLDGSLTGKGSITNGSLTKFGIGAAGANIPAAGITHNSDTILSSKPTVQKDASFSVDMGNLAVEATAAGAVEMQIEIGGVALADAGGTTIDFTIGTAAAAGDVFDHDAVMAAMKEGLKDGSTVTLGTGIEFTVSWSGEQLNFTQTAGADFIDKSVEVKHTGAGAGKAYAVNGSDTTYNQGTINNVASSIETDGLRANTFFTLDSSIVKDGGQLTIGDKTYTFAVGASSNYAGLDNVIDLTQEPSGTLYTKAAELLSQQSAGNGVYTIGANGAVLSLEEKAGQSKFDLSTIEGVQSSLGTGQAKFNAAKGSSLSLQIGDTSESFNMLKVEVGDMHGKSLGIDASKININEQGLAQGAMDAIKNAINSVSSTRGDLGALQNRLDHTINNLSVMEENITDAEATIRDTDVAKEMMAYTKNNILIQASQAMLAQANQLPQGVLQLLG